MSTTLQYTCKLVDKGHAIVAHCPELDVYSQGYTPEEARRNLREAVNLFLEEAQRMGTLERILRDAGYSLIAAEPRRPRSRSAYSERLELDMAAVA